MVSSLDDEGFFFRNFFLLLCQRETSSSHVSLSVSGFSFFNGSSFGFGQAAASSVSGARGIQSAGGITLTAKKKNFLCVKYTGNIMDKLSSPVRIYILSLNWTRCFHSILGREARTSCHRSWGSVTDVLPLTILSRHKGDTASPTPDLSSNVNAEFLQQGHGRTVYGEVEVFHWSSHSSRLGFFVLLYQPTAVPNKSGWEREEVQRQSGATKGQWDIYFYAPGRRFPLRSRPEIQDYCEKTLNVLYNPDEFSWKPTEAPIDTVSPVDTDNEGETQTMMPENDNADSDPECYTVRFAAFEIKYSLTFLCQGKMADVFAPCYFNLTQYYEDTAVLSDNNRSQAVVTNLEVISSLKQFGGHCQCHWNYIRGQTSNLQANVKVFHARFSREAIAQCYAQIEQDRFRRDLAANSGGSRTVSLPRLCLGPGQTTNVQSGGAICGCCGAGGWFGAGRSTAGADESLTRLLSIQKLHWPDRPRLGGYSLRFSN
uniref:MBD domain-containing protein n=1 Tax=Strigamia maritima TaxID=126957 RepID=T1JER3_STRMM